MHSSRGQQFQWLGHPPDLLRIWRIYLLRRAKQGHDVNVGAFRAGPADRGKPKAGWGCLSWL